MVRGRIREKEIIEYDSFSNGKSKEIEGELVGENIGLNRRIFVSA